MSRHDFVWMDKAESKCTPAAHPCDQKAGCARFLVAQNGRPQGDYTMLRVTGKPCPWFLDVSAYRTPPPSKDRPYVPTGTF